ncbi:MAG: Hsp20/alpha crystallin family protein [Anaerolineales bacterium]|nr:Hsp20/alpha crystallin family protein [Anaerolineales bacterium]
MNSLIRWDPFREMYAMRRNIDRLFDDFINEEPGEWKRQLSWDLALDVVENKDDFVVKASLPGIKPDDLDITYTENTLTIKGETKEEKEKEEARYHIRERRYGSFTRSITLPRGVRGESIEASYEDGVLTLRLPKSEEIKPKRIAVHSAEKHPMIEGNISDVTNKN